MKLNDYISQLCGLCARQVRANRAAERLHDRDFRGRNFNSPPRGDGNPVIFLIASPCFDFNSPPRGDSLRRRELSAARTRRSPPALFTLGRRASSASFDINFFIPRFSGKACRIIIVKLSKQTATYFVIPSQPGISSVTASGRRRGPEREAGRRKARGRSFGGRPAFAAPGFVLRGLVLRDFLPLVHAPGG